MRLENRAALAYRIAKDFAGERLNERYPLYPP